MKKKYEFETFGEREAFYKGISEAVGWLECQVIKEFETNLKPNEELVKEEPAFDYWCFIQKYYPNYYHCDSVLLSDIYSRILDGESNGEDDEKYANRDIRKELLEIDKELLSEAFENFFNSIYPEKKINMTHLQKIQHLESYLNQSNDTYSDTFKADILFYFNEDFTEENSQFEFLKELQSKEAIEQKVDFLLSQFVLKFDPEQETESDFIHHYLLT